MKSNQSIWSNARSRIAYPVPPTTPFRQRELQQNSHRPIDWAKLYWPGLETTGLTGKGITGRFIELGGGYGPKLDAFIPGLYERCRQVLIADAVNDQTGGPADGEVQSDIEVFGEICPDAEIVVYFGGNSAEGFQGAQDAAIADSRKTPSVISCSWGMPIDQYPADARKPMNDAIANAYLLNGLVTCVASGDQGSMDGSSSDVLDFPAGAQYALGVGGTTARVNNGQITETVWNNETGATGGGFTALYPPNAWEINSVITPVGGFPSKLTGHGSPVVCATADPQGSPYAVSINGVDQPVGGTSLAAPLWAAFIALLLQSRGGKPLMGFIETLFANPQALRQVTSGNNGDYEASRGWNACCGLGSPNGPELLKLFGHVA